MIWRDPEADDFAIGWLDDHREAEQRDVLRAPRRGWLASLWSALLRMIGRA